jgi:membrane protease YdiL (CAAX protease family)
VAAVVAVGVVPNLLGAVLLVCHPFPALPFWVQAVQLSVVSGCTSLVTLYLMSRSGEPWAYFGVTQPRAADVPLGLALLMLAFVTGFVLPPVPDVWVPAEAFARPRGAADHVLMVVMFGLSALAEELVTRAYLVPRLGELLRSRGEGVLFAAVLFASYHAYQGAGGVADTLAFGLVYGGVFLMLRRAWPLVLGHALYNVCLTLMTG